MDDYRLIRVLFESLGVEIDKSTTTTVFALHGRRFNWVLGSKENMPTIPVSTKTLLARATATQEAGAKSNELTPLAMAFIIPIFFGFIFGPM